VSVLYPQPDTALMKPGASRLLCVLSPDHKDRRVDCVSAGICAAESEERRPEDGVIAIRNRKKWRGQIVN